MPIRLDTGVSTVGKPTIQLGMYLPNASFSRDTDQDGTPDGYTKSAEFVADGCLCLIVDPHADGYGLGDLRSLYVRMPPNLASDTDRIISGPYSRIGAIPWGARDLEWKVAMKYCYKVFGDPAATISIRLKLQLANAAETKFVIEIDEQFTQVDADDLWHIGIASGTITVADWTPEYPDHGRILIVAEQNSSASQIAVLQLDNITVGFHPFQNPQSLYEYEFPIEPTVQDGISFPTMGFSKHERLPSGVARLVNESGGILKNKVVLPFRGISRAMHDMLYKFWAFNTGLTDVGWTEYKIGNQWPLVIYPNLPRYPFAFYCNWIDQNFPFATHEGDWISAVAPIYHGTMVLEEI